MQNTCWHRLQEALSLHLPASMTVAGPSGSVAVFPRFSEMATALRAGKELPAPENVPQALLLIELAGARAVSLLLTEPRVCAVATARTQARGVRATLKQSKHNGVFVTVQRQPRSRHSQAAITLVLVLTVHSMRLKQTSWRPRRCSRIWRNTSLSTSLPQPRYRSWVRTSTFPVRFAAARTRSDDSMKALRRAYVRFCVVLSF